jgi:hypothetical protein
MEKQQQLELPPISVFFPNLSHDDVGSICDFLNPIELLQLQHTCKIAYGALRQFWIPLVKRMIPLCGEIPIDVRFEDPRVAMILALRMVRCSWDRRMMAKKAEFDILKVFPVDARASTFDREGEGAENTLEESPCYTLIKRGNSKIYIAISLTKYIRSTHLLYVLQSQISRC